MQDYTEFNSFPFHSVLNFRLLIEFWEEKLKRGEGSLFPEQTLERIARAPELKEPIEDLSVLEKHRDLIEFLLTAAIPTASRETELAAATIPFRHDVLHSTEAFKQAIPLDRFDESVSINIPGNQLAVGKTVQACLQILRKFYGVDRHFTKPILLTVHQGDTGLDKVYKAEINDRFCEIRSKTEPKPIDPNVLKFLTEKFYDLDLWLQYIRPSDFEFQGLVIMRLTEVTEEEMLSSIKYDLLRKDAVVAPESFRVIQQKLRSIFAVPDLMLGLAYFDPNNNLVLNNGYEDCWKSVAERTPQDCSYEGSIYERSWTEQRYITIENLDTFPFKTKIEEALLKNNIHSILLAPLVDDGETIGLLELATATPEALNPISATKVENVLPMFTVAVSRVKSDMEMEVRALIQEECTAIHPAVQWRFFEAGVRLMNKRRAGESAVLEEIVFPNVFPFFGMVDIRNSSNERNLAVQEDLRENLEMARELLGRIYEKTRFPLLEDLVFKTDAKIENLQQNLASGDEILLLDFLKSEIHPLLEHFAAEEEFNAGIAAYRNNLDPVHGVVHKRRNAFEDSLNRINVAVAEVIDDAEEKAQEMFPHYFEKYKTDGVEFTLYLGDSLVQDKKFDPFFLKNFRLWQLLLMCTVHQRIEQLKPTLKNPLDITQLILVHDQQVTIRFRPDEKQFDVDGAYDIRYEIIKKRIDKAYIKDTDERLTQPGKIAVVYNHAKVAREYRQYFRYLMIKGLIDVEVEELELEELPGVNGLKALRVTLTDNAAVGTADEVQEADIARDIEKILNG